jgi:hypothetical protein
MFVERSPEIRERREAAYIHLNVDRANWYLAARMLEAVGGQQFLIVPEQGTVYRFTTSRTRDEALELVRGGFGWTMATPFDDHPVLGRRSRHNALRVAPAAVG